MKNKLLLVTFPVDLGNKTFEKRFIQLFKNAVDLDVYRFIPNQQPVNSLVKYASTIGNRFYNSFELQKRVRKANQEGRTILFHGVSPALFAYPAVKYGSSFIVTDWTRKLYEPINSELMSPKWLTFIHKKVLNAQKSVIGLTDAVVQEIIRDYDIPPQKLKKAHLPFSSDLEMFMPSPNRNDNEVRLLFVGGDFIRKGGELLLDWIAQKSTLNIRLTMVTNHPVKETNNVTVEKNIHYGQKEHIELYRNQDILVLPTKCDSYPSVLGEAACAGLAVLTTKNALGAPEVIQHETNGYISNTQEELLDYLDKLVVDKQLIESMKKKSRYLMESQFSENLVLDNFMNYLF